MSMLNAPRLAPPNASLSSSLLICSAASLRFLSENRAARIRTINAPVMASVCAARMRSETGRLTSAKCPTGKVADQTTVRATTNAAAAANTGRQRTAIQSRTGKTTPTGKAVAQVSCGSEIKSTLRTASVARPVVPSISSRRVGGSRRAAPKPTTRGATVIVPNRHDTNQMLPHIDGGRREGGEADSHDNPQGGEGRPRRARHDEPQHLPHVIQLERTTEPVLEEPRREHGLAGADDGERDCEPGVAGEDELGGYGCDRHGRHHWHARLGPERDQRTDRNASRRPEDSYIARLGAEDQAQASSEEIGGADRDDDCEPSTPRLVVERKVYPLALVRSSLRARAGNGLSAVCYGPIEPACSIRCSTEIAAREVLIRRRIMVLRPRAAGLAGAAVAVLFLFGRDSPHP